MKKELLEYAYARFGTPLYVFNLDILKEQTARIRDRLGPEIGLCFAMKANPFLTEHMAGMTDRIEVCSMGEYRICSELGIPAEKLYISGVMKRKKDIEEILGRCKDRCVYTVESLKQFHYFAEWADAKGKKLRLYPRLTSGNQFGMDEETVKSIIGAAKSNPCLEIAGIHYFSGTQKKNLKQLEKEIAYLDGFIQDVCRTYETTIPELEYGPGIAVPYFPGKKAETFTDEGLDGLRRALGSMQWKGRITVEMGRAYTAMCGYYLTEIQDVKTSGDTGYCIVDGGCHQLNYDGQIKGIYEPYLKISPEGEAGKERRWTICGALCSINDVLCRDVALSDVKAGKVLIFERTGAYSCMEGMALFLSHALPAVVLYSEEKGWEPVRSLTETYPFNMRDMNEKEELE